MVTPSDNFSFAVGYLGALNPRDDDNGTFQNFFDVVATLTLGDFRLVANADLNLYKNAGSDDSENWWGISVAPAYAFTDYLGAGFRYEYLSDSANLWGMTTNKIAIDPEMENNGAVLADASKLSTITATLDLKPVPGSANLIVRPEFRYEIAGDYYFYDTRQLALEELLDRGDRRRRHQQRPEHRSGEPEAPKQNAPGKLARGVLVHACERAQCTTLRLRSSSALPSTKATRSTSSSVSTKWKRSALRVSSGTSSRSSMLNLGKITSVMPARWAPSTFSFTPPIGSTRPRSVISPVIATERRTGRSVRAEIMAVAMAVPADGPSLGMAPAGTWMCTSSGELASPSRARSRSAGRR